MSELGYDLVLAFLVLGISFHAIRYQVKYKVLKENVEKLYYAAYWFPDRECKADDLWTYVRDAADLKPGETFKRLGPSKQYKWEQ